MGSNKLVLSVIMSLTFLSLTACKQGGGDTKRTTIRKGNATTTQTKTAKDEAAAKKQAELEAKRKKETEGKADRDAGSSGEIDPGTGKQVTQKAVCAELESAAKDNGWKIKSLELKDTAKTKITYYVLEASIDKFSNPVIYFKQNAFQHTKAEDLKKFKEYYDKYKIDPILMDMRGAGCSSALPDLKTKTSELSNYGAKAAVGDAEAVRKEVLKDKTWKVMAHGTGGMVALKYVQYAPAGLRSQSISIADFAPMKSQTELMKLRLKQEAKSWELLLKETSLTQEDVDKAIKELGTDKKLIHTLALQLDEKSQWSFIASTIKAIGAGTKKASDLKEIVTKLKAKSDLYTASRILDLDNTKNLSACADAIKTEESKTPINSCELEALVGHGDVPAIKNSVNHDALNSSLVKINLDKFNITYSLYQAGLSTKYPPDAYLEHESELEKTDSNLLKNIGSEIITNDDFLKSLSK